MATICTPFTRVLSSTIYLNRNRYKSLSFSRNGFNILSSIRRKPPKREFFSSQPLLHHDKFKCTLNAKQEGSEKEEDEKDEKEKEERKALETVLKLYAEIKNRNMSGIAEVIGDECQCFCNFLSTFRLLQGKKQVVAFLYWLMMMLGNNIKLIVKPTLMDGTTVAVQWRFEWEKPRIVLGNGYSINVCHNFQGKLMIRNLVMFMEPILGLETLGLRIIASVGSLAKKISAYMNPAEDARKQAARLLLLLALLLFAVAIGLLSIPGLD